MTQEQVEKGKLIINQIVALKRNIEYAQYTQLENVVERKSILKFDGTEIRVPESLFRIIGRLILSECNQKLIELEKELELL